MSVRCADLSGASRDGSGKMGILSLNQADYRKLISGRSSGAAAALLRSLLSETAFGYAAIVRARNFLYRIGWLRTHRVGAAVISVGNITTGGTGKTPLVVWVYKQIISNFKSQISDSRSQISDSPCAILTRGYKAAKDPRSGTQGYADEVAILAESCAGAKVVVNPDRAAGAAEAIGRHGAKVLVLDDGFQHRRLARDLDIVAIDATQPFGYGRMLPAGLLREPISSLKRAHAIVITRCDQVGEAELDKLEKKLYAVNPQLVIARSIHAPVRVEYPLSVIPANAGIQVEQLKGKKVFAFCGIGNPDAFFGTLEAIGCRLVGSEIYDDHYQYTQGILSDIFSRAGGLGADLILTTQKDWTKIIGLTEGRNSPPIAYLAIEIRFLAGEDQLTSLIKRTLTGKISRCG